MSVAYWISPKGEIIDVKTKHISTVIDNPDKFGFDSDAIEFIFDTYGEKIGTEGRAREQIMLSLFKSGWIRIRKYKKFYTVNVKRMAGRAKGYLTQWAQKILGGLFGFKEQDKFAQVNIDQEGKPVKSVELQDIAGSDKFVSENILDLLIETTIGDMDAVDSITEETIKRLKRPLFNEWLNESSLSKIHKAWTEHDTGTITAFRGALDCGNGDRITMKENKDRNNLLKSKLLKRGYGITKIKGSWFENGGIEKGEMSWFVVDLKDSGKLKNDLISLGEFFEQDAIIYAKKDSDYYAISSNTCKLSQPGLGKIGVELKLGTPKFGKTGIEGFSKIGNRPFVFEKIVKFDIKQNYYPTERRSIEYIDVGYPTKEAFLQKFKEFRNEGRF